MSTRVLVVDDAGFMRSTLREILARNGFEVVGEAKNGLEAVEFYRQLKPDLVTMDIVMPQLSGIEAVKAIIAEDAKAVIVMCSAMGQQAMVIDAIQAGARDFIVKPFNAERVLEAVNRALSE